MISREHLILVCKYYKGEERNPFEDANGPKSMFWDLERMFVNNTLRNEAFYWGMIEDVERYIESHSDEKNDLTDPNKYTLEQKAIIFYLDLMIGKWMPHDGDLIFKY